MKTWEKMMNCIVHSSINEKKDKGQFNFVGTVVVYFTIPIEIWSPPRVNSAANVADN